MEDKELCEWLIENSSGIYRNSELAAVRIAQLREELDRYKESFTTQDGVQVVPGDKIWVLSSMAEIKDTRVIKGCSSYMSCNQLIPVKNSFSSPEAARDYLKDIRG